MNGAVFTRGCVAGSGAGGGDRIMGVEAGVHNKLAEVWGFVESDRGRFDEVLGGWILCYLGAAHLLPSSRPTPAT